MISPTHYQRLLQLLADGDLSFYGSLSADLSSVPEPERIKIGDLFVGVNTSQAVWYEVLEPLRRGSLFVRCFSATNRRGEYDRVKLGSLSATVTRELFERARTNGFRTVRRLH